MKVVNENSSNFYEISQKIKLYRVANNLTQKEFGSLIGVGKNSINNYENCSQLPTVDTMIKLANLFNITLDALLQIDTANKDDHFDYSEFLEDVVSLKGLSEKQKSSIKNIITDLKNCNT